MGKQTSAVDRQQNQFKVAVLTEYFDLGLFIPEFEVVVHVAMPDDLGGSMHQQITFGEAIQKGHYMF